MAESSNTLQVEVVSVTHMIWQGEATMVRARTVAGDLGVLPGHAPVLGKMAEGELLIRSVNEGDVTAHTKGGFFSVDSNKVTVVADDAKITSSQKEATVEED